jgi:class 3 adenylate cyclase/tetratricopeptide (TPR) repeat protein
MKCLRCQQDNPPQAKFCFECAAPFNQRGISPEDYTPAHLAEKIRAGKRALEGERKRVTVMFADLESSMALLAGRDPEDARLLLDGVLERMMEAVHRYEGTVNQIMGDGIMALFGAPVAHEDHALRACHAALRMQETVKQFAAEMEKSSGAAIRMRVGVHSGEVLVRSIASDLHMDYSAIGQTTHVAAKVEQMAAPGAIYATAGLMQLVEGHIQGRRLESRSVKGLADPLELFEITGSGPLRTRFEVATRRGLTPFVGREVETAALREAAALTREGQGRVVAVIGQPGVGKSRLLWEITQAHRASGWSVLKASTSSHGEAVSYLPVIELLSRYFDIDAANERGTIGEKIRLRLFSLDASLAAHLSPLLALFDVPTDDPRWAAIEPLQRHRRTIEAVSDLLIRESRAHPLIVVIEDLHTIDVESQELLDAVAARLAGERLLVVVEHRPEYTHDWSAKATYVRVDVRPLPQASAGELVRSLMGDDPALAPVERLILERTEGNPFFIEESLRSLIDTQALAGTPGAYRLVRPLDTIDIPATVQDLLAARVDRLPDREKALLQLAAVIGRTQTSEVLERVAGLDEASLGAALSVLVSGDFIAEASPFPTLEYSFKHAFTQQVAYSSLLQNRRRVLHARIMEAIESLYSERLSEHVESLAHHAVRGEQWKSAVRYLRQAAHRAVERSANRDAIRHLEEAIRLLPNLPQDRRALELAIDLRLDLRNPLVARGSFEQIIPVLREAAALTEKLDDPTRRARVAAYVAGYYWLAGKHEAAVEAGERALKQKMEPADLAVTVTTRFYVGASRHSMADYRNAMDILAVNLGELKGANVGERFGMAGLPSVLSRCIRAWCQAELGEFSNGLAEAGEALEAARSASHPFSILTASFVSAVVHLARGDLADAIRILEQGLALSRAERVRIWFPAFALLLAQALALSGRATFAVPMVQKALPVPTDAIYFAPFAVVAASEVYLLAGQTSEANVFGARALELAKKKRERGYEAWAMRVLGELELTREPKNRDAARAQYLDALALADALSMRPLSARCHLDLGLLYVEEGVLGKADQALTTAAAQFEQIMSRRAFLAKPTRR